MQFRLVVGGSLSKSQYQKVEEIVQKTFQEINNVFNNWNPHSEISRLNRLPAEEKITLSPSLASLLKEVNALHTLSEGRFDPTIEPLQQLWKTHLKEGHLPPASDIQTVLPAIGWNHVHLEEDLFWKDNALTALDLGGIAKGYALDLLVDSLHAAGYEHLYAEWGGEIRTQGSHPEGRPWRIAIAGMATVQIETGAIATSGDYYQCWEIDGETYFHIIDPRTKEPLKRSPNSIATTSVLAPTCALADGIATALMLFSSSQEAAEWASHLENIQCWVGTRS